MAYAAKYASAFYGPIAMRSARPRRSKGDKRTLSDGPRLAPRKALREVAMDIAEGYFDMVMVKPGLPYPRHRAPR